MPGFHRLRAHAMPLLRCELEVSVSPVNFEHIPNLQTHRAGGAAYCARLEFTRFRDEPVCECSCCRNYDSSVALRTICFDGFCAIGAVFVLSDFDRANHILLHKKVGPPRLVCGPTFFHALQLGGNWEGCGAPPDQNEVIYARTLDHPHTHKSAYSHQCQLFLFILRINSPFIRKAS